jgi:uncharacterized protein (TIGR02300 family)
MPELKLGSKHECYNCGTKFYDLGKSEPLCPKCGANQKDASTSESPSAGQAARRRRKADVAKVLEMEEEEVAAPIEDIVDDELVVGPDLEAGDLAEEEAEEEFEEG